MRSIQLSHIEVPGSTLCFIIRAPKALETLKIPIEGLWQKNPWRESMRPKELGKSLLQQRNTLKMLELDISEFDYTEGNNWEEDRLQELEQSSDEYS
ncbi:f-box domain protein [Fusarium beomiforme]|uniref:F-box domain protein n=1 Tax=Fusarium beomiforme TaxID=44412 RepID=A0A9P5DW12_9HYPO|nr:f-box domain protein [Fusarium beomiforme]